jgi:hypothetical protein
MRGVLFCVAWCVMLAGCIDAPSTLSSDPANQDQLYCQSVARARAGDAAVNGFEDIREQVYSGTYADCIIWRPKQRTVIQN